MSGSAVLGSGMKDPVIKGHPLHAMLSDLPIGITGISVIFDLLTIVTKMPQWKLAAIASVGIAFLAGSTAAVVGWWDYQAVPHDHPAHHTGALHGYCNVTALVLLLLSFISRSVVLEAPVATGTLLVGVLLSLAAFLLFTIAGWLGGEVVFKLGWRVTPAEHAQLLEEYLQQHDQGEEVQQAHVLVEQYKRDHTLLP
jgi:uncharacterized membrane protein